MKIRGIRKTTLVDYPGKVATTIFTGKCNFRCPYCHNPTLVEEKPDTDTIPIDKFLKFLEERRGKLGAVCITGGEPTLQPDIKQFIEKIKDKDYLVKLDTNGSNPEKLKKLLPTVDYVAMDIKAPKERYQEVTRSKVDPEKIQRSIDLIKESDVEYEFRTTVAPDLLDEGDMEEIGKWLDGSRNYYIQQFSSKNTLDPDYREKTPYPEEKLEEIKESIEKHFGNCEIRS